MIYIHCTAKSHKAAPPPRRQCRQMVECNPDHLPRTIQNKTIQYKRQYSDSPASRKRVFRRVSPWLDAPCGAALLCIIQQQSQSPALSVRLQQTPFVSCMLWCTSVGLSMESFLKVIDCSLEPVLPEVLKATIRLQLQSARHSPLLGLPLPGQERPPGSEIQRQAHCQG